MEFVPWKAFGRIIERQKGDAGVCTLGCAELLHVMAFAQLTWRESFRDIEVCLTSSQAGLFHALDSTTIDPCLSLFFKWIKRHLRVKRFRSDPVRLALRENRSFMRLAARSVPARSTHRR